MTEAQTWAAIGAFTTTVFAMLTIVSWLFVHVVRAEVAALRSEMNGEFASLRSEMTGEIGKVAIKLEHLDRDVQAIARHVFPDPP